jgi:hypothetical protein
MIWLLLIPLALLIFVGWAMLDDERQLKGE